MRTAPSIHCVRLLTLLLATLVWPHGAAASPAANSPVHLPADLSQAAPCVQRAATYHHVNPWALLAILKVESNFSPGAVNRNHNGTVDVGMAQINSIHFERLKQYGVTRERLMDGCVATFVAAWHLRQQIDKHGNTWFGVAAYHSTSPCLNHRYGSMLWNALTDWGVVPGPRVPVRSISSCTGARQAGKRPAAASTSVAFDAGN